MDIQYLLFLQELRSLTNGVFDSFFLLVTRLGDPLMVTGFVAGMYWCVDKRLAVYLLLNLQLGGVVNQFLKLTACVYRPWIRSDLIHPVESAVGAATGYSFPSGHTAIATALWGGLGIFFNRRKIVRNFMFAMILLIGFSRNYLGVHTPQDVFISLLIGGVLLYITHKMFSWLDEDASRDRYICVGGVLLSILLMIYASVKTYPVDYVNGVVLVDPARMMKDSFRVAGAFAGFSIGWFIERRFIGYNEKVGSWRQRGVVFLGGCALLLPMIFWLNGIFVHLFGPFFGNTINWAIILIFILAVYPIIVNKMRQIIPGKTKGIY